MSSSSYGGPSSMPPAAPMLLPPPPPHQQTVYSLPPEEDKTAEKRLREAYAPRDAAQYTYASAGLQPIDDPGQAGATPALAASTGAGGAAAKPVPPMSQRDKYASLLPGAPPNRADVIGEARAWAQTETGAAVIYTLLALVTRVYRIGRNASVIWDEAHFGKFGSYYLRHTFYFDVHPPLGKILVGLAGWLSGYSGSWDFNSGEAYPAYVYYYPMRIIMSLYGVAMVPMAWYTSRCFGWDRRSRHLLTLIVLVDNAWLTISRFILLDSMLLCFTFATVLGLAQFHQQQHRPFTRDWWVWLAFTGASIGCVSSVKWVGFFATALVGLYTVEDLWEKFGDLRMPVATYLRHWAARIGCLILLPFTIYALSFKLHFMLLYGSGPGDAQMSSLFQAHLSGNDFADSPLHIALGSKVTLKNMGYGGGLLHSHVQTYPVGSGYQQVTCYHYKDENNEWVVSPTWESIETHGPAPSWDNPNSTEPVLLVRDGDVVRLQHMATGKNLHSHTIPAPVTKENYEVAGYGDWAVGDKNDYWVVEIVGDIVRGHQTHVDKNEPVPPHSEHLPPDDRPVVHTLTTKLRFRHQTLGCYLYAGNEVLPQWGWKQVETTCIKPDVLGPKDEHAIWNVESHWNQRLPKGDRQLYPSPFWRDFVHLNVAMMTSNNALTPDADKEDMLASGPYDWPFLYNGLRMNGWGDDNVKYYLIGNPFIWCGSTVALGVLTAVLATYAAMLQRGALPASLTPAELNQTVFVSKIALVGWFLHYLPFLIMGRVTYIHHYVRTGHVPFPFS